MPIKIETGDRMSAGTCRCEINCNVRGFICAQNSVEYARIKTEPFFILFFISDMRSDRNCHHFDNRTRRKNKSLILDYFFLFGVMTCAENELIILADASLIGLRRKKIEFKLFFFSLSPWRNRYVHDSSCCVIDGKNYARRDIVKWTQKIRDLTLFMGLIEGILFGYIWWIWPINLVSPFFCYLSWRKCEKTFALRHFFHWNLFPTSCDPE